MGYLALSIFFSSCLPLLFKAFPYWKVRTAWAIPANYLTCTLLGAAFSASALELPSMVQKPWAAAAVLQGVCLAGTFFLLAFTAQWAGVAVAALASRLAVAIPVAAGFILYDESLGWSKGAGLGAALLALYLSSLPQAHPSAHVGRKGAWMPAAVFLAFGFHFSLLKFVQQRYLASDEHHPYVMAAFLFALGTSLVILAAGRLWRDGGFRWRHLAGGVLLGLCNYTAFFCLTRVLSLDRWESSVVFPVYSVGVVVVSTFLAAVLYREPLSRRRLGGIGVGLAAVALLNL